MEEETIYNLIPKEYVPPAKEAKYKSKYPNDLAPTGSTFINYTTSRPKVANLKGEFDQHQGPHTHKGFSNTFGKPKGTVKPNPVDFRKKATGTMGSNLLPEITNTFKYPQEYIKPSIPKKDEAPILGLKTNKNFIVANAVENILAPAKQQKEDVNYVTKKDYGKTPQYLKTIQNHIQNEYNMLQNMHIQEANELEKQRYSLSKEEVLQLKDGLKKKWEVVNKEYQQITHINKIDTTGLKRKKEDCERELIQLEKDMAKLNKQYVFVDTGY